MGLYAVSGHQVTRPCHYTRVKKSVIPWDKYKGLASKGGKMVSQEEEEQESGILVCICFETRELGWLLIMNSEFCL